MGTRLSVPTSNSRSTFVINDFSGGLVNNVNDVKMLDKQSPDMLNMQFRNDGLLQKRPGTVFVENVLDITMNQDSILVHCIPYEYEPNKFLNLYVMSDYSYYIEDGMAQIFWVNPVTDIPALDYDDEQGEWVTNFARKGVNRYLRYVQYNGSIIFTEGTFLYEFKYEKGVTPKVYKYVNPPKDFTPKPTPSVTGETKTKFIKTNTYGRSGCDLYEKWYEPCQYELEDGYKGTNFIPPAIGVLALHKDRLYVSGYTYDPNIIWISDILNPCYFPTSLTLQTPPTDDLITALHIYNDELIIARNNSIYSLSGNTNREDSSYQYNLYKLNTHTGMPNDKCANQVYNMMFFVGSDGNMYKLHPPSTVSDSIYTTKLNLLIDITLPPFNLNYIDCMYAISAFDSSEGLWYVQIGDHTLVYNYQLMIWTRYNNINAISFHNVENVLYFTALNSTIYKLPSRDANQKYYDEIYEPNIGSTIKLPVCAYWTSRNMDMGQPARVKQFRDTYIVTESFEEYSTTVNVKYEVDYIDIQSIFLVENEISKWDKAIFDKSTFVSRNIDRSLPLMINRRGRTLKVYYGCGYEYKGVWVTRPNPGEVEEYKLVYVKNDDKVYLRVPRREGYDNKFDKYFIELGEEELNQALLVHNITGIYELKGYR